MLVLHCWSKQLLWRRETSKSRNGLLKKSGKYFFFLVWHTKAQKLSCSVTPVVSDSSANPWTAAHQASVSFTISQSLLKLTSIESVIPSNQLNLFHTLLLLPSVFPSIRVFSNELALVSGGQSIGASANPLFYCKKQTKYILGLG